MVALVLSPRRELASCCSVLVVNGGNGLRVPVVLATLATVNVLSPKLFKKLLASCSVLKSWFSDALNSLSLWLNNAVVL